jgi:trehalose/maltose hydrolase-like predicted phosphorylase
MVNLPNWLPLTFAVPGSACFSPWTGDLLSYRQELDMRHGVLHRQLRFVDAEDRMTSVRQRRLVSMADPYLAALETPSWPRTGPARFTYAPLSGRVTNRGAPVRQLRGDHLTGHATGTDGPLAWLRVRTRSSGMRSYLLARRSSLQWREPDGEGPVEGGAPP